MNDRKPTLDLSNQRENYDNPPLELPIEVSEVQEAIKAHNFQ